MRRGRKKSPAKTETDDSDVQKTRVACRKEREERRTENAAKGNLGKREVPPEGRGERARLDGGPGNTKRDGAGRR